jgi:O-acetylserine/cysteine efflux transporter
MMKSNRLTVLIFILVVIVGGSNAVAVRFSNAGLPPFWGAALRFALAGLIFWVVVLARRIPLPKGEELKGAVVYGLFTVGIFYALVYWGFVEIEASLGIVILTLSPLFTFFFAVLHRQEAFRWQGLLGALIAFAGIVVGLGTDIGESIPLLPFLAVVAAAAVTAEGQVLYKQYPPSNPFVVNAIGMSIAPPLLLLLSVVFGEARSLPTDMATWSALAYLTVFGTAILFYLYLYVLDRWTASATTYSFLLFPVSTVFLASWLLDEQLSSRFLLGGVIVLVGVWLGAFFHPRPSASE